jgi:hypothetical protein
MMGKLLYFNDDDGKTYEVTRPLREQLIADARAKAGAVFASSGDADKALAVFQKDMENIAVLIKAYKNKFGDPYPALPRKSLLPRK